MGLFFFCGKVYIVMYFFCIYKISYQILFGFTVEYVFVRKKVFYEKKCQSIILWQNVEINN